MLESTACRRERNLGVRCDRRLLTGSFSNSSYCESESQAKQCEGLEVMENCMFRV